MFDKLEVVEARYEELTKMIGGPDVIANQAEWQKLIKEHSSIEDVVFKYREYKTVAKNLQDAKEMFEYVTNKETNFGIIEELIVQHEALNKLYPLAINSLFTSVSSVPEVATFAGIEGPIPEK